jgi:hypothetical protein
LLSPDSDEGFNIRKNRERAARLTKMRKEATASIASGASEAGGPPESNYPTSGRSEGNEEPQEEDTGDMGNEEDQDEDQDGEDDVQRQDSDLERRAYSRMIRHGLDPNDDEVQDVLRHGPPRYEEGGGESDTNAMPNEEGADPSSPGDPEHEYNFNEWVRYIGDPMQEGAQTNVDKLTRYRIRGDQEWLPIPDGLRVPRCAPDQEQHADQHTLACRKLGKRASNFPEPKPSKAPAKAVRRDTPPPSQLPKSNPPPAGPVKMAAGGSHKPKSSAGNAKAKPSQLPKSKPSTATPAKIGAGGPDKPKSSAGNAKVNPRGLMRTLMELGMAMEPSADAVVDESETSGSDYSETRKDAQRRRGGEEDEEDEDEEDEDEEDEDDEDESEDEDNREAGGKGSSSNPKGGGEETSDSSEDDMSAGDEAAEAPARKSNDKGKAKEMTTQRSLEKRKGKQDGSKDVAKGAPGRPGKEQMQAVKELRTAIEEHIKKLSKEFNASRESLLGQLGMGGKEHRKVSLLNLFSQIKSLEEPQEGVHGCWC